MRSAPPVTPPPPRHSGESRNPCCSKQPGVEPMRLDGKVCIITGAGSGQGRASALRFAEEGADVVIAEIDADAGAAAADEIGAAGGAAIALPTDVSVESDWERVVAAAVERFGRRGRALQQRRGRALRGRVGRRRAAGDLGSHAGGQPHRPDAGVPPRHPGDAAPRRRFDHQHVVHPGVRGRQPADRRLHGHQGGADQPDALAGRGVRAAGDPGQRHRPRHDPHAHGPGARRPRRPGQPDAAGPLPGRALRRARRDRRPGAVPGRPTSRAGPTAR